MITDIHDLEIVLQTGLNLYLDKSDLASAPPKSDLAPHFVGPPSSHSNEIR